jgi:hypothetical protein
MARFINCGPGYNPEPTLDDVERFLFAKGREDMSETVRRQRQTIERLLEDIRLLREVANELRDRLHRYEPPRAEPAAKDYRGYGD